MKDKNTLKIVTINEKNKAISNFDRKIQRLTLQEVLKWGLKTKRKCQIVLTVILLTSGVNFQKLLSESHNIHII